MTPVTIIIWLIIGAATGWLTSLALRTENQQSLLVDIVVGIVGGFIGGIFISALGVEGTVNGLNLGSLLTSIMGAILLLGVMRALRQQKA